MPDMDLTNLPDDPESLMKVFDQLDAGGTVTIAADEPAQPLAEPQAPKEPQQQEAAPQAEPTPEGISTKDGKHVIPYTVLEGERKRASRAEQLLAEANERLTALEAKATAGDQGANNGESARTEPAPAAQDLSPEDLEDLKENFPTVYKATMAALAKANAIEASFKPVQEAVHANEADRVRTAAESVQDAIDSIPVLAHIQSTNAEAFELAKQFDATLRQQPAWASKPLAERFQKATEMVEATLGPIALPAAPKQLTSQDPGQLKAAALAKAAQTAKAAVPTSLSDFPAGSPAAVDERQSAEAMSPLQLAEKIGGMSADQMDAYFATL